MAVYKVLHEQVLLVARKCLDTAFLVLLLVLDVVGRIKDALTVRDRREVGTPDQHVDVLRRLASPIAWSVACLLDIRIVEALVAPEGAGFHVEYLHSVQPSLEVVSEGDTIFDVKWLLHIVIFTELLQDFLLGLSIDDIADLFSFFCPSCGETGDLVTSLLVVTALWENLATYVLYILLTTPWKVAMRLG